MTSDHFITFLSNLVLQLVSAFLLLGEERRSISLSQHSSNSGRGVEAPQIGSSYRAKTSDSRFCVYARATCISAQRKSSSKAHQVHVQESALKSNKKVKLSHFPSAKTINTYIRQLSSSPEPHHHHPSVQPAAITVHEASLGHVSWSIPDPPLKRKAFPLVHICKYFIFADYTMLGYKI